MIYPDIETFRRDSDSMDEIADFRRYQLEKNCSEIFAKAPALAKDFLETVNSEIVPNKTYLFGYELNTKKILFISGLFLLFFFSLLGAIVMWLTDFFDNTVLSTLVISNTSEYYSMWAAPSVTSLVSVYIFNYTNVEFFNKKFENKLRVQEIGPYVYEEAMQRVNVKFDDESNTVSYQEKRSYKFRPDLSKGRQSDRVTVPNLLVLASSAAAKHRDYFLRLSLSTSISIFGEEAFVTLPADRFIVGYNSQMLDIFRSMSDLAGLQMSTADKIGLFSSKIGVQPQVFMMNTGKNNIDNMRIIEKVDNKSQFDYWSTEECNSIAGSDGATYPPKMIQRKEPVRYVTPQMCRTLPLVFEKEENILNGKIPAYKYVIPEDIYDSAEEKPENQCFCSLSSGECPLKGVFNATPCNFGVPVFVSHPHFYRADEAILNSIDGLKTLKKDDVQSFLNIHPTMGFIITGRATIQLNIQVQKSYGLTVVDRFEEGQILPLAWIASELNEKHLPKDFIDIINESTFTLKGVKMAFKYGFLLTTLITLVCIILVLISNFERPETLVINMRYTRNGAPEAGRSVGV